MELNKKSYSNIYSSDGNISLYDLVVAIYLNLKKILLITFFGCILGFIIANYLVSKKYIAEVVINDSYQTKFVIPPNELKVLNKISTNSIELTEVFLDIFLDYNVFLESIKKYELQNRNITTNLVELYDSLKVTEIIDRLSRESDNVKKSYKLSITYKNNIEIGKMFLLLHMNNSSRNLSKKINNLLDNEVEKNLERIETLKFLHQEDLDIQEIIIYDQIKIAINENKTNDRLLIETLKNNLYLAKEVNYIDPQFSLIVQNPFDANLSNTYSVDEFNNELISLYKTKSDVPLYFFGTKVLEKELEIINDRFNQKPAKDVRIANYYDQIDEIAIKRKEIYIAGFLDTNRELKELKTLKSKINMLDGKLINYNKSQIQVDRLNLNTLAGLFISFIVSLLIGIIVALFYNESVKRNRKL